MPVVHFQHAKTYEIHTRINSLAPEIYHNNFKSKILKFIIQNSSLATHHEIGLRYMPQNLNNGKSILVQAMARGH